MIKMERLTKMSFETAQELRRDEIKKRDEENLNCTPLAKWLLDNFTKEELEGKKGFTWEDSFDGGFRIIEDDNDLAPKVGGYFKSDALQYHKDAFKTESQAKSALAFAQLSHIVSKHNASRVFNQCYSCVVYMNGSLGVYTYSETVGFRLNLPFLNLDDAYVSMEVNRQLWLDYWEISSVTAQINILQD